MSGDTKPLPHEQLKALERTLLEMRPDRIDNPNKVSSVVADTANKIGAIARDATELHAMIVAQRQGWREIGEVLIKAAFGFEMRGFGDTAPLELLDAVRGVAASHGDPGREPDAAAITAIREAMIGRTWHVGGHKGYGTCDYPLCKNRGKGVPLSPVTVLEQEQPGKDRKQTKLMICAQTAGPLTRNECQAWAEFVVARAAAGSIQVT